MAYEGLFNISVAAVVEEVLRQHGTWLSDTNLASRKAEEAAVRRYEAAGWLRKTVGAVAAKDLPDTPSEEEFRLGLRSGLILCNALNKIQPGAVPKVVVNNGDKVVHPDGAALLAYQYFENIRNFLVSLQDIGLPVFEASDLEKGGKSGRVVDCILALKSYEEWKVMGGTGSWRYSGNVKSNLVKCCLKKNSDPLLNSSSRTQAMDEKLRDGLYTEQYSGDIAHEMTMTRSLSMLVHSALSDKKPEEVPVILESLLSKIMEEMEHKISSQQELVKMALRDLADVKKSFIKQKVSAELVCVSNVDKQVSSFKRDNFFTNSPRDVVVSEDKLYEQQVILVQQQKHIEELRQLVYTTRAGMKFLQMKYSEELSNLGRHMYGLAHAASGYRKVLEENRKLYNEIQDLKGSIRVYCRVRPFLPGQLCSSTIGNIDGGSITIITPSKPGKGHKSFTFNKVFGASATQEEVFTDTRPLIRSVLDGYNVCIFAYGQTGSGKTYTMNGPKHLNEYSQGVNYRALFDLFHLSELRRGTYCYEISVQMIEIYNEQVRDLLVTDGPNIRLEIHSTQGGLNVPGANLIRVASPSDVIQLMNIGQKNRAVGATALNDRSSRSHSCLTVHVQGRDLTSGTKLRGCMHLVDLAGSERVDKSEVTGERLRETQHINRSLSALGDVISALSQKSPHIPYRNSKLTQLLQDSLGGQAKTLMFVHVSPEADAIGETISTLKFAERVSTVELGAAQANKETGEVKELKEQLATLKALLAKKEGESARSHRTVPHPDFRMKKGMTAAIYPTIEQENIGTFHRQPMEDVGNIEVRSDRTSNKKGRSYDLQELLRGSDTTPWLDNAVLANFSEGGQKEEASGGWVDKTMVNKHDSLTTEQNTLVDLGDGTELSDFFYQRYIKEMKGYSDEQLRKNGFGKKENDFFEVQKSRFNSDSDDQDIATSDSSETDALCQINMFDATSTLNSGSRFKKHHPNPVHSPDIRIPSHSQIPPPSQRASNGSGRDLSRLVRQTSSDGKLGKSRSGRLGSRK